MFDILIIRKEEGYSTTVYGKSQHQIDTSISPQRKLGKRGSAIRTLKSRPVEYCSDEFLLAEALRDHPQLIAETKVTTRVERGGSGKFGGAW